MLPSIVCLIPFRNTAQNCSFSASFWRVDQDGSTTSHSHLLSIHPLCTTYAPYVHIWEAEPVWILSKQSTIRNSYLLGFEWCEYTAE